MTTILTKKKDTSGAPAPGDLTNAAGGAELAVNTADKRLYTKNSGGNVVEIGTNPTILNIDNIQIDGSTISSTNTNGNINLTPNGTGAVVVSKMQVTGALQLDGNITVGDSSADTLTINSTITSNLLFTDNTYDIGASGATRPRNLFLAGSGTIGGNVTTAGRVIVDDTTDSTSATTGSIQTDGGLGVAKALFVGTSVTINGGTANGVAYLNGSKVLTSGSALTFDGTNLGFGGTGQRITGDFSNATLANRVMFQTSTTNGNTGLAAIPNGTGNSTGMRLFNSSDITNSAGLFVVAGTDASIQSIITGTGTYLPMTFYTGGSERMRLDTSGNLGINTSSAGSKLTVLGTGSFYASTNANTGSGYGFTLTGANSKSSASDNTSLALFSNDALASNPLTLAMSLVGNATVANGYAYLQASEYGTGNWRSIALNPSGGNVGIGTNSIQGKFNVASGRSFFGANSETYSVAVGFTQSRVASGQVYYIGATDSATPAIVFSNAAGTERVRITDGGDLLVGGTSGSGRLSVFGSGTTPLTWTTILYDSGGNQMFSQRDDGAIYLGAKSASPYNLTTSNAANAHLAADGFLYRSTSSLKYKRDVQDTEHGLAEVLALRPVTYKGKSAADGDTVFGGLIAEEVHEAGLTEFVQYAEDGSPDALAYGNMVSLCIKAIQEQQAIIEQLKARLDAANL